MAIKAPLDLFATLKPLLEQIKSLAGSSPSSLMTIERAVAQILKQAQTIPAPDEFRSAHALLVTAVQLAGTAGQIRREATLTENVARAWDASAARVGRCSFASPICTPSVTRSSDSPLRGIPNEC